MSKSIYFSNDETLVRTTANCISVDDDILAVLRDFISKFPGSYPLIDVMVNDFYGDCRFTHNQVLSIALEIEAVLELMFSDQAARFWISILEYAFKNAAMSKLDIFCYAD